VAQAEGAQSWPRPARTSDLLLWLWRLLSSGQFAVALIGFLALAGLVAVLLPQVPVPVRDSPAAVDAWLETQRGKFGPFTGPLHRAGLFNVVEAWWFLAGLALLALSVCVYAADRFIDTWRNVTRPRERLGDAFFERAANRVAFAPPAGGAAALEALLRARRFSVRTHTEGRTAFLFADRFAWAQLGTFVSHLALIVLFAGALVSRFDGYTNALLIAEGTTSPVFPVSHPNQMQLEVVDAVARFDEEGVPLDYRSELVVYQGGREVARGEATVNGPLSYGGYRFHQAGYLGEGAALRVRDISTGNTVYSESLALSDLAPAPALQVRDADGRLLLDDVIVPTDFIGDAQGTLLTVPGSGRDFWVGMTQAAAGSGWNMIVYERDDPAGRFALPEGGSRSFGGLSWTFVEPAGLPSIVAPGVPGDRPRSLVMLSEDGAGTPYLTLLGPVDGRALTLREGEPVAIGGLEYSFEGRREFAGIEVRRDPGAKFIWLGAGLLLFGLLITFYVPRLRLWARVRDGDAVVATTAERRGVFQSEARRLLRDLGVSERKERPDERDA
jgi:cytochrome c biogenesis protein ResB